MKRRILSIWLWAIMIACRFTSLGSCSEDLIWDFYPVEMSILINDSAGNDLLDKDTEGSLYGTSMSLEYNGNEYELAWPEADDADNPQMEIPSRMYLAVFQGITFRERGVYKDGSWTKEGYEISLGEFPGDGNYDHTFKLTWDNGKRIETIRITNTFYWEKKNDPHCEPHYYLNGEECRAGITLIK